MSTAIIQLIAGAFVFGVCSCEYSTTPKGEEKQTHILKKGNIRFYRKRCKLTHNIGCIHLEDNVYPTLSAHENEKKNAVVTKWRTGKLIYLVHIWDNITTIMNVYPRTSGDTPLNTVWLENHKTTITVGKNIPSKEIPLGTGEPLKETKDMIEYKNNKQIRTSTEGTLKKKEMFTEENNKHEHTSMGE